MKLNVLLLTFCVCIGFSYAQEKTQLFAKSNLKSHQKHLDENIQLPEKQVYDLEINSLKEKLADVPNRFDYSKKSSTIISFPNAEGMFEDYIVYENPIFEKELAEKYPEIKSYIGVGITHPESTIYFSISPLGFKSMTLQSNKQAIFVEPLSSDLKTYTVYTKADKAKFFTPFECKVVDEAQQHIAPSMLDRNADDGIFRTFRLAVSVTGEYTAYFGGTKAQALAAIANTMTRVNGVFEKDFGIRMVLIANNDLVIYTNASTDPYSPASTGASGAWNTEVQNTLTSVLGNAAYDIGHLFGATGGGGNAGCIGCVCRDDTSSTTDRNKGSAYTSPANGVPAGDAFDIDYVAHEIGHQFGGNHTFTFSNEGTIAQVEPGSGSTIMGYAGITNQDVQLNSDAYFHAISIQQITNYIKTTTCQTNTSTGNAIPIVNAGLDYTIPRSTPFMLTGTATDANGDALTYCWEQMNTGTSTTSVPNATRTSGPAFRSYTPTSSPTRIFPRLSSVLNGATTTSGSEIVVEALPSVARTFNFRLTVRDNRPSGPANNSDDVVITVNGTAGPFSVTAPNTAVSYDGGSNQTITWNVAGTTANNVNCANVDILLSTDGGQTFPIALASSTPNDGTQVVTIPNIVGTQNRIMIKGTNHIFFDISNANFTITNSVVDTTPPTAPLNLVASGTTTTSTNLSWTASTDNVGVSGYDVFRDNVLVGSSAGTTFAATGLTASTTYTFFVRAKDAVGNFSTNSNTISITTLALDTTPPTAPINLVASGTTATTTNLSWTASTDNVGVTGYDIFSGTTLLATVTGTTYAVTGLTASTSYSFFVRARDAAGNISSNSNTVSITTLANSITYCTSRGNSTADEFINRFQMGSINNLSGNNGGYANFTTLSTNITRGAVVSLTITPGWTSTVYSEAYRVWIDYNGDGDFTDAGEQVFNRNRTTATPISGSFTVPTTAVLGPKRMRVSMKYNASPTPCEVFSFGEVEDYTVNIVSTAKGTDILNNTTIATLYPNPVSDGELFIMSQTNFKVYSIYNTLGQKINEGNFYDNKISVSTLANGTYLLVLQGDEANTTLRFIKK